MLNNKYIKVEQIEVKISELVKYIARKAILILMVSLIVAILLPVSKLYLDARVNANKNVESDEYKYEVMKLTRYETQLQEYYKQYESMVDYRDKSIIMNMDSNNVYVLSIQFIIEADREELTDIMTAYSNYYLNGDMAKDMCDLNNKIEEKYLDEIISVNCSNYSNYETSSVLNVKLYGMNEEFCGSYSSMIKEVIMEFGKKIDSVGRENEINILQEEIVKGSFSEIKVAQDSKNANLANLETNISNLKIEIENIKSEVGVGNRLANTNEGFDIKYLFLGFGLGMCITVVGLSIIYIFSNKVKYAEEVAENTDMILLGKFKALENTLFDRFFKCKRNNELQKEIVINKIKMLYDTNNGKINAISVSDKNYYHKAKSFFEKLDISSTELCINGDITSDIDAMKLFDNSHENIVLIIYRGRTKYININDVLEICNIKKITVLGYIYVE